MTETAAVAPPQSELAYVRLYDAIRSGTLKPGDRVRETEVSERIGLSRTPVREALRRLEADGVIEHRPRQGAVIRSLSQSEVVELYEMRVVFERTAAEMAARHASAAELDEIEDLNRELRNQGDDPQQAGRLNANLHRCIYLAARNRFLMQAARTLDNTLMLLGPTTLDEPARIALVCRQHGAIIDALRAKDADAAGTAAVTHIETSLRHRLKSLRQ